MSETPERPERQVGCETDDGLLNIHSETETCDVCAQPEPTGEGEPPIVYPQRYVDKLAKQLAERDQTIARLTVAINAAVYDKTCLQEDLEQAEARLAEVERERDIAQLSEDNLLEAKASLKAEALRYREALEKSHDALRTYGKHPPGCAGWKYNFDGRQFVPVNCDCPFGAALTAPPPPKDRT